MKLQAKARLLAAKGGLLREDPRFYTIVKNATIEDKPKMVPVSDFPSLGKAATFDFHAREEDNSTTFAMLLREYKLAPLPLLGPFGSIPALKRMGSLGETNCWGNSKEVIYYDPDEWTLQFLNPTKYKKYAKDLETENSQREASYTFKKYTDYDDWETEMYMRDAVYDESEIDGHLVGIAKVRGGKVCGLWYNKAKMGTFVSKGGSFKEDLTYSERDPNYPYGDDDYDDEDEDY